MDHSAESAYGLINDAALLVDDEKILWCGRSSEIPSDAAAQSIDLEGRLVTPALIDCHTHVVYGGHRANEFEMRLNGKTYEEVAKAGGGIISTVSATRTASLSDLVAAALPRVDALIAEGVATIEIKSGYGLDIETELNMLRAARAIESKRPVTIKTSFLGAHAVPPEFTNRPDNYIDEVCIPTLHLAHKEGLVDAVDGFCEGIGFSTAQMERVFTAAKQLGIPVKLHAEQLSNIGGIQLAAEYDAISVDHIEYANEQDVKAMAAKAMVGVLLPGAFYTIRETQDPPVELMRKHKVNMAVATDCNPGSSPLASILLAMNMACTLFRLTPEEALAGVTRNAALALGQSDSGVISAGKIANLAIWDVEHPAELAYRIGFNPLYKRIFKGRFLGETN